MIHEPAKVADHDHRVGHERAGDTEASPLTDGPKTAHPDPDDYSGSDADKRGPLFVTALAALGVVYGDIGTSPLYALKQCFHGPYGIAPTTENVLGILSLIVWSLILVVSVKYLVFVLRANNRGEGGIIALVALLNPWHAAPGSRRRFLMLTGLFGAALLYGDGTITPAISILSAIEGLQVATPAFAPYVLPIAIAILVGLFAVQRHGTSRIGTFFGPVMLVWFITLGALGLLQVIRSPHVLVAVDPAYAVGFLIENRLIAFIVLGTVFLVVTGAETLYADMGHFGRQPIQLGWFAVALPALLLNYFGQGSLVLDDPGAVTHPFYGLAADWALYPLVILATAATVIASQAVISGAFSLTRQAVQLGQLPRMRILQTDSEHFGQIYIPAVNWMLMLASITLMLAFKSSTGLAGAYGLAVSTDMVITTMLAFFVAVRWKFNPILAGALALMFLPIDLAFFGANLFKIADGGWYPLVVAATVFTVMGVWRSGLARLGTLTHDKREPLDDFLVALSKKPLARISGTAVFMTSARAETPSLLLHHLEHNRVLHERVLLMTILTEDKPRVPSAERIEWEELTLGFHRIVVRYGFMQSPNVPVALRLCERFGLDVDPGAATFYLGHEEIIPSGTTTFWRQWHARLFAFMWRNATRATAYYKLPPDRVVAIGQQVEM
jgi:KUP system potassium uptake protein